MTNPTIDGDGPAGATRPAHRRETRERFPPVMGVTLAQYVEVSHRLAGHGYDPRAATVIAAELGISPHLWPAAAAEWDRRLVGDRDVAAEFHRLYKSR